MERTYVNIACGDSYVDGWHNLDYLPHSSSVSKANLLERLPIKNNVADVVYSSHFLEHIPRGQLVPFLSECFRITKPGGKLRLVLPDLEVLCSVYLGCRGRGEHEKADFLILEMIDQCVRYVPGGELGAYFKELEINAHLNEDKIKFVRKQTGHVIKAASEGDTNKRWHQMLTKILARLERWYCKLIVNLLPRAFRQQNVSFAEVGERHAWVYDFYTVEKFLRQAGFVDVKKMSASTSSINNFPFKQLDLNEDDEPRKGMESMYLEASKP
jgi:predicted SAM-dependent methyltransferase